MIASLALALFLLCQLECVTMSDDSVPENTLSHRLNEIRRQQQDARFLRLWNAPGVFNINALDELDPVHVRRNDCQNENSYDGDGGRDYEDHMRANGVRVSASNQSDWTQIGDALPVIEAPSIVAEQPSDQPAEAKRDA